MDGKSNYEKLNTLKSALINRLETEHPDTWAETGLDLLAQARREVREATGLTNQELMAKYSCFHILADSSMPPNGRTEEDTPDSTILEVSRKIFNSIN